MEILRIGEDHTALRDAGITLPCLITYILAEYIHIRVFFFVQPHTGKCRYRYFSLLCFHNRCIGVSKCPLYQNFLIFQGLVGHIQADRFLIYKMFTVHICFRSHPVLFLTGDHHRCKEPFCIIMQGFPSSLIIYRCPGSYRPAVI